MTRAENGLGHILYMSKYLKVINQANILSYCEKYSFISTPNSPPPQSSMLECGSMGRNSHGSWLTAFLLMSENYEGTHCCECEVTSDCISKLCSHYCEQLPICQLLRSTCEQPGGADH